MTAAMVFAQAGADGAEIVWYALPAGLTLAGMVGALFPLIKLYLSVTAHIEREVEASKLFERRHDELVKLLNAVDPAGERLSESRHAAVLKLLNSNYRMLERHFGLNGTPHHKLMEFLHERERQAQTRETIREVLDEARPPAGVCESCGRPGV